MTTIPEPDIDYEELERTKVGESFHSKTGFFKKAKWVLKLKEGFIVFDKFDNAMLGELIHKTAQGGQRKMGNFKQATKWLEQGKIVRRPSWEEDSYWELGMDGTICWIDGTRAHIHMNQIYATDFEVYEEDKKFEIEIKKKLKSFIEDNLQSLWICCFF